MPDFIIDKNFERGEIATLAQEHNIEFHTLWTRIYILKWDLEKALNTPVRQRRKQHG